MPSFKGVAVNEPAAWLRAAREGVDRRAKETVLHRVAQGLVEASVPAQHKVASRSLAIDWTDHETWSRPRAKNDPARAMIPSSWGHAKRNAPGAKDHLFFGYYAQVATMVKDHRDGPPVPELVRRIAFAPPRDDPPR